MDRFDDVKRQWASRCWQSGEKFAEGEERHEYGIGLWCHPDCWQDVLVGMEAEVEARSAERDTKDGACERALEKFMEHDSRERRQKAYHRTRELFGVEAAKCHRRIADEAMRCARNRKKPTA